MIFKKKKKKKKRIRIRISFTGLHDEANKGDSVTQ
jgi:hypothetical protein